MSYRIYYRLLEDYYDEEEYERKTRILPDVYYLEGETVEELKSEINFFLISFAELNCEKIMDKEWSMSSRSYFADPTSKFAEFFYDRMEFITPIIEYIEDYTEDYLSFFVDSLHKKVYRAFSVRHEAEVAKEAAQVISSKKHRYEEYLKLKKEFENSEETP